MASWRLGCVPAVANTTHLPAASGLKRGATRCIVPSFHQRLQGRYSRSFFGLNLGSLFPSNGSRVTASTWVDNSAQVDVNVPLSFAWDMWSDKEGVNRWMPWISSIKVLEDKPAFSRWTLKYEAFGQPLDFSWLSENFEPIHHQKIHWRSVDGLPNRGAVRFYPRGPSACRVQLTISYEIPELLRPVGSALSPFVEEILQRDLQRFAELAAQENAKQQAKA